MSDRQPRQRRSQGGGQKPGATQRPAGRAGARGAQTPESVSWRDRIPFRRQQVTAPQRRRRVPRHVREAQRQRMLYWGMGIAAALCVLILIGFAAWEYQIKPNQTLAKVNGTEIKRKHYWKVRAYELFQQAELFAAQNPMFAEQLRAEARSVWGSTDVQDSTLSRMIDDQLVLQNLDELGLEVTDQDIETFIIQQYEPLGAPVFTPTPSPTLIPTRAAWATETAVAMTATAEAEAAEASPEAVEDGTPAAEGTPGAESSPVADAPPEMGEESASPEAVGSPEASPMASPVASPEASPRATSTPTPTPNPEQARQTAEAGFQEFKDDVFDDAHLSQADYERWIVRPAVARDKVRAHFAEEIGQSAEQVHAAHILVETKDLADQLYQQLQQGADFAQIAKDNSVDEGTAPNGGDLGWFPRGIMVKPFEDVAFSLQPGQISEPFETEFGWHIVTVFAHEQDRPLTDDLISQLRTKRFDDWLAEKRESAAIDADIEPTPTPVDREFEPPPAAPPTPTPTPTAVASPEGSPEADPGEPIGSPEAGG